MEHRKIIVLIVMFFGAVLFLSYNPGYTGSFLGINYMNNVLLIEDAVPGTTIEEYITFNLPGEEMIYLEIETTGEVGDWIQLEDKYYQFLPGKDYQIPFQIEIPEEVDEGKYKGKLVIIYKNGENNILFGDQELEYLNLEVYVSRGES